MKWFIDDKNNKKGTKSKLPILTMIVGGIITGGINGFFGGGGGNVIVPLLSRGLHYNEKPSHATAILIMLPISIMGSVPYLTHNKIDLRVLIPVMIGSFVGGVVGSFILKKIKPKILTIIFCVLLIFGGIKCLF